MQNYGNVFVCVFESEGSISFNEIPKGVCGPEEMAPA